VTVAGKAFLILYVCLTVVLILIGFHIALHVVPPDASQGNVGRIFYGRI
jgi:hypothetical protein